MAKETKKYDEDYLNGLIAKAKKSWEGVDVDSYMSELRDDLSDKEVAENLSKEVTSHIIEQIKSNMNTITVKCRDLMVGDWVTNEHGLPAQIINVDNLCAFTIFGGNEDDEGEPWVFDDSVKLPVPIPLTPEILEKNGFTKVNSQRYDYGYPDTDCYVKVNPKKNMIHVNGRNANSNLYSHSFVHELQRALRLCGLDEIADNFKV